MPEVIAAVTSKGQVTIPKPIRDRLGIGLRDRVVFMVDADGHVTLRALDYPTVASLAGAAGSLRQAVTGDVVKLARGNRAARKLSGS